MLTKLCRVLCNPPRQAFHPFYRREEGSSGRLGNMAMATVEQLKHPNAPGPWPPPSHDLLSNDRELEDRCCHSGPHSSRPPAPDKHRGGAGARLHLRHMSEGQHYHATPRHRVHMHRMRPPTPQSCHLRSPSGQGGVVLRATCLCPEMGSCPASFLQPTAHDPL